MGVCSLSQPGGPTVGDDRGGQLLGGGARLPPLHPPARLRCRLAHHLQHHGLHPSQQEDDHRPFQVTSSTCLGDRPQLSGRKILCCLEDKSTFPSQSFVFVGLSFLIIVVLPQCQCYWPSSDFLKATGAESLVFDTSRGRDWFWKFQRKLTPVLSNLLFSKQRQQSHFSVTRLFLSMVLRMGNSLEKQISSR